MARFILHELQRDGSIWKSVENFCLDAILPPYIWGNLDIPFASKTMQKKGVRHCVAPLIALVKYPGLLSWAALGFLCSDVHDNLKSTGGQACWNIQP